MKKIKYSSQFISKSDIQSVTKQLKSEYITRGPSTNNFENKIKKVTNSKYSVVTNSATASLIIACKALGLKKNDVVWTTANSFASTANSAILCGAKVDFVDIELKYFNLCLEALEKKLKTTKKLPKIIIPIHYAGYPMDMKKFNKLKKKYKFKIIEDASHAIGAKIYNQNVGDCKYSDITVFSFQAVKVITTGEGGCITTNDKLLYEKCKILRSHGITKNSKMFKFKSNKSYPWYYEQIDISQNYFLPDINCALGISQISSLKKNLNKRSLIYKYYKKKLVNTGVCLYEIPKGVISSHHLLPAYFEFKNLSEKAKFFKFMSKNNIFLQVHYIPIYKHPYFRKILNTNYKLLNCEKFYKNIFSLPMHFNLKKREIDYVCKKILSFVSR